MKNEIKWINNINCLHEIWLKTFMQLFKIKNKQYNFENILFICKNILTLDNICVCLKNLI